MSKADEAVDNAVDTAKIQGIIDRRDLTTEEDPFHYLWTSLGLPPEALFSLHLPNTGPTLPSSFKLSQLVHASIALSTVTASLTHSHRTNSPVPRVTVPPQHASTEFKHERPYKLNGNPPTELWGPMAGLHTTNDGHVRILDAFPNHLQAALDVLGLPPTATHSDVTVALLDWEAVDLETVAFQNGACIPAVRSYHQ